MYPVYAVPAGTTLYHLFNTFAGATGAPITLTGLAVTDIEVYKNGSVTQRSSDAGYALLDTDGIDFDGITGTHGFSIDLSDNTDAGFYAAGSWYHVVINAVTVDGNTMTFVACAFRIMEAETVAGRIEARVASIANGAIAAATFAANALDAVWSTATRLLTAGTNIVLAKGTGITGFNDLSAAQVNAEADTAISDAALATAANLAIVDGIVDAIKLKTDNLPDDPADQSLVIAATNALAALLGTPAVDVSADIAALKVVADAVQAKTDNLPADPADASVIAGLIAALEAKVDAIDDFLDTEMAAVLEDTSTTLDDYVDDLETRLTAALATALQAHALGVGRGVMDAGSTTTALVFKTVNGAAPSATDDFYNGRHIVFTSGTLALQATSITDYTGATVTATVPAVTGAPAEDVTFIIV